MADVKREVLQAYADSANYSDDQNHYGERDLDFLAPNAVQPRWATEIMKDATPQGYNAFEPELIKEIADMFAGEPKVILGRENSVVAYIIGVPKAGVDFDHEQRMSDEHHVYTGQELIDRIENKQEMANDPDSYRDKAQDLSPELRRTLERADEVHRFWWD